MQYASMLQEDIYKTESYSADKPIIFINLTPALRENPISVPNVPFMSQVHAGSKWGSNADLLKNLICYYGWLPNEIYWDSQWWKYSIAKENYDIAKAAPVYPAAGSIIVFDDCITVKLAD